jgi:Telomere resolvase
MTSNANIEFLAGYLQETHDYEGVLDFIREKWPKSMSTYISCIRSAWMQLEKPCEKYERALYDLMETLEADISSSRGKERSQLLKAKSAVEKFSGMNIKGRHNMQRAIRWQTLTGVPKVDEMIQALPVLPDYIVNLKMSQKERDSLAKKSSEALQKKSLNSIQIDACDLIEKCISILEDIKSNPFDLACALGLLSGRRMVELFKTAEFEKVKGDKRSLLFRGQAKKAFQGGEVEYHIPTLVESSSLVDGLKRLRGMKPVGDDMTNKEVNLKWSNSCNCAARRMLGEGRHFHELRAVYAVIAFHATMPHTLSLNAFVAKVLGHAGLNNSLNYTAIHTTNVQPKHMFKWKNLN